MHTELWVSNRREHLTCARVREAPQRKGFRAGPLSPHIYVHGSQ